MSNETITNSTKEFKPRDAMYSATITYSTKELTPREKLKAMNYSTNALALDHVLAEGDITLTVKDLVTVSVENGKSESKNYEIYLVICEEGLFYTGSKSFLESLNQILSVMAGTDEPIQIRAFKMSSKNRVGQSFITCTIV